MNVAATQALTPAEIVLAYHARTKHSLKRYAGELGLNTTQFETDLQSSEVKNRVDKDMSEATSLGVTGTPTFFINGRSLVGSQPFSSFATVINAELQRLNIPVPPAAAPN